MVVGNGLLARAFDEFKLDTENLVFASGVSNSMESNEDEFDREKNLLYECVENNKEKRIIYFSTVSILDRTVNQRQYVVHKTEMESLIREYADRFTIFRLSNIVGEGGNQNTILNFLIDRIEHKREIGLWKNAFRNFLDVVDLVEIIKRILKSSPKNGVFNIANIESLNMFEIVNQIEIFMNKTAVIKPIEKGHPLTIEVPEYLTVISDVLDSKINQGNYFFNLLNNYYSNRLQHGLDPKSK